jgi:site-specific recombinase XerD
MPLYFLVYLKRCKVNRQNKSPLFLRVSIHGDRAEIALRRFINSDLWDNVRQCVKGRNEEAKSINEQIETYILSIQNHHTRLLRNGEEITAQSLKSAFLGINIERKSVVDAFEYHNLKLKDQIGKGFAKATYDRYITTLGHLKEFLKNKYNANDISLHNINLEFLTEFEFYLRIVRACNNNTTVKYIKNFKKVINLSLNMSWMDKNPFANYKCKLDVVERECLHEHELEAMRNKVFKMPRLEQVKDCFLFCCYTGLAYADVKKLSKDNLIIGFNGAKWIQVNRTKTNSLSKIPLLPMAQDILDKYVDNPYCVNNNRLLPVLSNQKVNAYLKEIADLCGIEKNLTSHLARHTFATTVTLSNGIPIETVSKMLGHKSIKTTQQYSKVLDVKVSEEMNMLREKYSNKPSFGEVGLAQIV